MTIETLTWMPAWRIRELIAKREVSAREVTEHFLERIERFNPTLKAVAYLDAAGAREQADRADAAVRRGDDLGLLHGVPAGVKEQVAVQGMPLLTARGDPTGPARDDDLAVERLRKAGAIIVGTNTMMWSGGQAAPQGVLGRLFNWEAEARNPWDPTRVPGWSSSGGAASVAAALLPIALGSDGGGSTRLPAAYSGVVGVHPTRGLVPYVNYERPTFRLTSTIGPLSRSVRDAATVLQAIAGPDGRDYICNQQEPPDYLASLDAQVTGMRVAWTDDYGYASRYASEDSPRVIDTVRAAAMGLSDLGVIVEPISEVWEDPRRGGGPAPGEPSAYEVLPAPTTAPLPPVDPEKYRAAMETRARNWQKFRVLFGRYDLLLSPTSQRVARSVEEWADAWTTGGAKYQEGQFAPTYVSHTVMFNLLGFPAVSVPCGFVDGLPVGLQIVGWPGSEPRILQLAAAFQRAFPRNERPQVS